MVLAAILAVRFRCHLPLSVALVWVNTPLTYVPVFYFEYRVGDWILGRSTNGLPDPISVGWLLHQLTPLWIGAFITATVAGGLAYLIARLTLRLATLKRHKARHESH